VNYSKLNILRPQVKSLFVHGSQDYRDISHIVNNKLCPDIRDVLLDPYYHIRLGIMKTRHIHYFHKDILVQDVESGVNLDHIPLLY